MITITNNEIRCAGLVVSYDDLAAIRPATVVPALPANASRVWYKIGAPAKAWSDTDDAVDATGFDTVQANMLIAIITSQEFVAELEVHRAPALTIDGAVARLREYRDEQQAVCLWTYNGSPLLIDADDHSIPRITGAVQAARIAQDAGQDDWLISWTTADNHDVILDAAAMIELGLAVLAHTTAVHCRWRELRGQLEAAADVDAAWAIDITVGWPQ